MNIFTQFNGNRFLTPYPGPPYPGLTPYPGPETTPDTFTST